MKKYILSTLILVFAVLVGLVPLVNLKSIQSYYEVPTEAVVFPPLRGSQDRLTKSIQFKTISQDPRMLDTATFDAFGQFLRTSYPSVFETVAVDTFSSHTYLLHWPGTDEATKNYLFIAHQDVVPVDKKSSNDWSAAPFSGDFVADSTGRVEGWIYGRGTLDDKSALIALMETIESLSYSGFQPKEHLYFCFGQDEEIGGKAGAAIVAAHCREKGLRFDAILDEGGIISTGSIPGLKDTPVALIGTAEKGYLSVEVSFNVAGGHSSMPNTETAITRAAAFTEALSDGLFQSEFSAPLEGFIAHLAPEMPWTLKSVFANRFLTEPLLLNIYQQSHTGRALTNNTAVATMISSGIKDNVVPASARVVCNTRILPGTTPEDVLERYAALAAKFGGTAAPYNNIGSGASPTSSTEHEDFVKLGQAVKHVFPEALVSPYLTIGGTDSKNFEGLAQNTYRFLPIALSAEEVGGIHGTNERISVNGFNTMVDFYTVVMQLWSAGKFPE
ncbi:MAG: M20/M25/M40 family metallo-hydrolase [Flavobacteriaceae bacterium]|nr:M20/M25/M40 family metallo-hydrolase [Flavobacteriaceae bacterium]